MNVIYWRPYSQGSFTNWLSAVLLHWLRAFYQVEEEEEQVEVKEKKKKEAIERQVSNRCLWLARSCSPWSAWGDRWLAQQGSGRRLGQTSCCELCPLTSGWRGGPACHRWKAGGRWASGRRTPPPCRRSEPAVRGKRRQQLSIAKCGRKWESQDARALTDSLSEAEELRARAVPLLSDWLVRVERRVDWKLLLVNRSLPETQSSAPR